MFEFEAAWAALLLILEPARLGWLVVGSLVGLTVGLLPGLGGIVGMSVLLPFVFGMDPYSGTALLIGMAAVVHTGDTFPSVMLGVPGTAGSQATIMDGYPLAQQGQASRALNVSFFSSMFGGVLGAVFLFVTISVARPLVLALRSPELFALTILGLSLVGILARGAPLAGLLVACMGLVLGTIGLAPGVGVFRFTFDSMYLFDGVPLAVLALGLFAIPEMIDLLVARESVSKVENVRGGKFRALREVLGHKWLVVRSAAIGAAVGVVPGIGGSVVDWLAYGVTQQSSKDNQNFGKGDIRGVIGPEAANNAKEGGALLPTLVFAIPGSGTTAIRLGALLLMGLEAGPAMVSDNLDVTLSIVWTLSIANVLGTILCLLMAPVVARIAGVPAQRLVPVLLVLLVAASYQSTRHWGDIATLLIIGLLAWVMKQVGWPRAPLLIGFVLALPSERYLHISMQRYEFEWLTRPGVIIIFLLSLALVFGGFRFKRTSGDDDAELALQDQMTRQGDE